MELTPKQQTIELIKTSERILLLIHQHPDGDALGSLLALFLGLKKLGKQVTAASPEPLPKQFGFLPKKEELTYPLKTSKDFVIVLDLGRAEVDKLGYKVYPEDKKLNIVVTPKAGEFQPRDVTFVEGTPKYDLIIVLDSPDLERLGPLYEQEPSIFYETPLINIDHHPSNEYFGKVNWVDLTATSTAEILVSLLEALSQGGKAPLIDEEVATLLLTGIITDTSSFQNTNTTPKSLTVAAQLVAAGADQQEIVKRVYKTKSLSTLRLWGKILSRVVEDKKGRFIYAAATFQDFEETGASSEEVVGVLDELLKSAPGVDFVLLLYEAKGLLNGSLRSVEKGINVSEIASVFGGGGHEQAAAFRIKEACLATHQDEILDKIRSYRIETQPPKAEEPTPPEPSPPTEVFDREAQTESAQTRRAVEGSPFAEAMRGEQAALVEPPPEEPLPEEPPPEETPPVEPLPEEPSPPEESPEGQVEESNW